MIYHKEREREREKVKITIIYIKCVSLNILTGGILELAFIFFFLIIFRNFWSINSWVNFHSLYFITQGLLSLSWFSEVLFHSLHYSSEAFLGCCWWGMAQKKVMTQALTLPPEFYYYYFSCVVMYWTVKCRLHCEVIDLMNPWLRISCVFAQWT